MKSAQCYPKTGGMNVAELIQEGQLYTSQASDRGDTALRYGERPLLQLYGYPPHGECGRTRPSQGTETVKSETGLILWYHNPVRSD